MGRDSRLVWIVVLSALATLGCASSRLPGATGPTRAWTLTDGQEGPEVDDLVRAFYESSFAIAPLTGQADRVLDHFPHSSRAHEVAGFLSLLRADDHAAGLHFKQAAEDRTSLLGPFYLSEADSFDETVSDEWDSVALARAIRAGHPDPHARAAATQLLAGLLKRLGDQKEADRLRAELHPVDRWVMAGAFDNDQGKGFFTTYPPETTIDLRAEMPGVVLPARWRAIAGLRDGLVPVGDLVSPRGSAVYLLTYVHADHAQRGSLRLTTDTPARIWWNDGLIFSEPRLESSEDDNLALPVALHAGWNKLLVKSGNRSNSRWVVGARFTDEAGAPLAGLSFASDPRPTPHETDAQIGDGVWWPGSLAAMSAGRRRFLTARLLTLTGVGRKRLAPLQQMLAASPRNPAVQYQAALAYWDNEETGKALDLLTEGIAQSPQPWAFLIKRARFYGQKQQLPKAQADLQTVTNAAPQAHQARLDLASLLGRRRWLIERCQTLEDVVKRWPDSLAGQRDLAWCLEDEGYVERSAGLLREAARREPGNLSVLRGQIGQAVRRWDYRAALALTEKEMALDPYDGDTLMQAGELLRKLGDDTRAQQRFEQAAALDPDSPRAYQLLGDLAARQGKASEAIRYRKLALDRDPGNTQLAEHVGALEPARLGFMEKYVPTDAVIEASIAAASKVTPAPGSQVLALLDHEVTLVAGDGSAKQVITIVSQAQNVEGRDSLTQARLVGRGDAKILRAYSVSAKGERAEASSMSGSLVRFRNLDVGSIIVLQYLANQNPRPYLPNHYSGSWYFQTIERQTEQATWILVSPKGHMMNVEVVGDVKTATAVDGDHDVRTFTAAHVPPLVPEIMMSPATDILRRVSVSSVPSWDEFVRWERALLTDAFRSNDKLQALVNRLTAGATTPAEKRDRLFHFVAHDIRYQQEYEDSIAGVRPHAAPVVIERGYGDCKDKAVLFIQMARLAGIKIQFALLRTTNLGQVQKQLPFQQFNHAIVYIPAQPGLPEQFLDGTADDLDVGNLPPTDQGALSLVLDPETGAHAFHQIPYAPPDRELLRHHVLIQVTAPDAATATDEVTLRGSLGAGFRRLLRNDEAAQKSYQQLVSGLFSASTLRSGSAENKEDIWKPLVLKLSIDVGGAIQSLDQQWRMVLPGPFGLGHIVGLAERHTPLRLGAPQEIVFDVDMQLPNGFEAKHLPATIDVKHRCFDVQRSSRSDGDKISVHFDFVRRCTDIPPADYADLREAAQKVQRLVDDQIVFARASAPAKRPAHARRD